jgi:hypothetical protein
MSSNLIAPVILSIRLSSGVEILQIRNQQYLSGAWRWKSCLDSGVLLNNAVALRRLSMVVAEQPTEALTTYHLTRLATHFHLRLDQLVVATLMIALSMIMRQILPQNIAQRHLTHDDYPIKRFLFDRAHDSLAMGIQVWRSGGLNHRLNATVAQELVERVAELGVSVVDQIALTQEEAIERIGQLPRTLHHEGLIGMWADPGHVHSPRVEIYH